MATRRLTVEVVGDARKLGRTFDDAERKSRGLAKVGGLLAGAFSGVAIVSGVKAFTDAARDANRVASQTDAVITSTHGATRLSARGFADLASQISKNVAVDDDLIQAGENILATFTRVKAGGPDRVFERATVAAVDMTAAMNHGQVTASGLKSANIQLGKALNDPIKGISSLTRVGVTFSAQQKAQIADFVKNGQVAKAQGIILAEVTKEFGGSAKASATDSKRLAVTWGNMQEQLGNLLIPAIDRGAKALAGLVGWVDRNRGAAQAIGIAIAALTGLIVANTVATKAKVAWDIAWAAGTKIVTASQWALNVALRANPIGLVITAIALLAAGLIYAYKHSATFRKIVDGAFRAVADAAKFMWNNVLKPVFSFLVRAWLTVAGTILRGAALAFGWVPGIGPKLRTAQAKFHDFAGSVNRSLNAIDDEGVNIKLRSTFTPPKGFSMHSIVGAQHGMRIPGFGGGDIVPAMLEPGEAVVPKDAVRDPGFMSWAGAKGIPGFQRGGLIPHVSLFSPTQMAATQTGIDERVAAKSAAGIWRNFKLLLGGGPGIQNALRWARSQEGKPYIWGGVGPAGYDCSGFMSAITNVIMGRGPHSRLFATGTFPASGWARGFSPIGFSIGSFRGSPGHMAGTLGGVNVESRGSAGVVVGGGARGARSALFGGNVWHLAGRSGGAGGAERWAGFDSGGWLPPGLTLAYNGTGRPERVMAPGRGGGDVHVHLHGPVYGDRQALIREVRDGLKQARRFEGKDPATV